MAAHLRYRFDDFVLDPVSRTLEQDERPCALSVKAFDTLLRLVQQPGEVVSKETLLRTVWAGVTVDENNLSQAISMIRKAIGDTGSPRRFILTVPGQGYRFLRPVALEPHVDVDVHATLPAATADAASPARRRAWPFALVSGAAALLAALVATAWIAGAFRSPAPSPSGAELTHAVPLTSDPGEESWPAFSPDDTRLAFSWRRSRQDEARIAVKIIGTDSAAPVAVGFSPVWSPDGRVLAFQRARREPAPAMEICLIPALGGAPRVLYTQPHRTPPGLVWWEGGNALVFSTRDAPDRPFHLAALDLTTLTLRALTTPPPAPVVTSAGDSQPAIAPDRRTLAFVRETHEGMDVFVTNLATPDERRLTFERQPIWGLAWASDGKSLILSSTRRGVTTLYRLTLADGRLARVPHVEENAIQPAMSHRGERLAFRHDRADTNIYRVDLRQGRAAGPPRRIIASSRLDDGPHISPDGRRIAFESSRSGATEIWVANADGTSPQQVTFLQGHTANPAWSPDGARLAFEGRPSEALAPGRVRHDIWVVDAQGGIPRPVTADPSHEAMPAWSANGQSIYFLSERQDGWQIWKVSASGGPATRITENGGLRAQESRDGSALYYVTDEPAVWRRALDVRAAGAHVPDALVAALPHETLWGGDWIAGDHGLYVLGAPAAPGGGPAIELLPFRGPPRLASKRLVSTRTGGERPGAAGLRADRPGADRIIVASMTAPAGSQSAFSIAPDESWLVWSQRDYHSRDIVLLHLPR